MTVLTTGIEEWQSYTCKNLRCTCSNRHAAVHVHKQHGLKFAAGDFPWLFFSTIRALVACARLRVALRGGPAGRGWYARWPVPPALALGVSESTPSTSFLPQGSLVILRYLTNETLEWKLQYTSRHSFSVLTKA